MITVTSDNGRDEYCLSITDCGIYKVYTVQYSCIVTITHENPCIIYFCSNLTRSEGTYVSVNCNVNGFYCIKADSCYEYLRVFCEEIN